MVNVIAMVEEEIECSIEGGGTFKVNIMCSPSMTKDEKDAYAFVELRRQLSKFWHIEV